LDGHRLAAWTDARQGIVVPGRQNGAVRLVDSDLRASRAERPRSAVTLAHRTYSRTKSFGR
ncbi:hypothetical protein, partial [Mycobacterium sp.]|uniref:hypothetical protein n=1 Tax=Mycobacterium sp. TaxID=1785 RepID=UPI0031D5360D